MQVPVPLVLQRSTSVAQERSSSWNSADSVLTELRNRSCSLSEVRGWLCWQYELSHLKSVPNVRYIQGQWTTLATWLAKSSMREWDQKYSTWQWLLSGRCVSLVALSLSMCNILLYQHIEEALWQCYNKLNNYDIDLHCIAPSKMKLIYV